MLLTNLGKLLREKRKILGKTQFQIAELANIDEKHYGRIERNECLNPGINTILQICNAMNISPFQLFKK